MIISSLDWSVDHHIQMIDGLIIDKTKRKQFVPITALKSPTPGTFLQFKALFKPQKSLSLLNGGHCSHKWLLC